MKKDKIRRHYESRLDPERASYDILDWASPEAQQARFQVLGKILQARPRPAGGALPHLLDVGCGLADLHRFLHEQKLPVTYVGVDITPGILREAARRQPGCALALADVFAAAPFRPESFDYVFASGVFNLELGNNHEFIRQAVPGLCRLARVCAVVNFLHARTPQKYPHCHYSHPDDLRQSLKDLAPRIELIDHYLEADFTLVFWK